MKSETDVLEMTSRLRSDTNTDQTDKVLELKETYESQKKWINALIRGRLPMQLILPENIADVAKKMTFKSFVGLMKSCKWVNAVVTENKPTFFLQKSEMVIDYNKTRNYKLLPKNCQYCFHMITFCNFENNVNELLAVLNSLNGTVLVTEVELINTVAIKELFLYLRPTILTAEVRSLSPHFYCPIAAVTRDIIPGYLREIKVDLDGLSTVQLLDNMIFHFVGRSEILKIKASFQKMSFDILYDQLELCMKNLAISRKNQWIYFRWVEYLTDENNVTIMEVFHSKAECSGLMHFPTHQAPYFYLFPKAEPGFVATKLWKRGRSDAQIVSVEMKYCPTMYELREFAIDLYSNDASEGDDDTLKILRDKIEDHFSSTNVHDTHEPFEEIEEQEFQLQPKQLEASELQLILDWKQRKPLPQLSWRLPVTEQVEQQLELLREAVDIQEQWITFLRKGKYIFEEIPHNCVLEILKRMDTKAFVKALRTCKEIKKFIDYGRPTFTKYVNKNLDIERDRISKVDQWVVDKLDCRNYFRFNKITFSYFKNETEILQTVVSKLADRNIFCDRLDLRDTALTQEIVEFLRSRYIDFFGVYYGGPQNYPEYVIKVGIEMRDSSWLIPAVEDLAGKHFDVQIKPFRLLSPQHNGLFMEAIRCFIEKIKSHRGNGQLMFDCFGTSFRAHSINQKEISQRHDCFSHITTRSEHRIFMFVAKATGGVVAGVFRNAVRKFIWQFVTTMEDFEKLFVDGTKNNYRILEPKDEIAFSTIRSYFSQ